MVNASQIQIVHPSLAYIVHRIYDALIAESQIPHTINQFSYLKACGWFCPYLASLVVRATHLRMVRTIFCTRPLSYSSDPPQLPPRAADPPIPRDWR